jgi:hypothetical protein
MYLSGRIGITRVYKGLVVVVVVVGERGKISSTGSNRSLFILVTGARKTSHIIARGGDRLSVCERERNGNERRTRGTVQIQGYDRNRKGVRFRQKWAICNDTE